MVMNTRLSILAAALAGAESISVEHKVNPIRRVVTMLQMMQNKVAEEGQKKKEIFDKFMCYCDNADTMLGGAIQQAENKLPMLESQLKEDAATKKQLDADVEQHGKDRIAAKEAISKATAQREKENAEFLEEEGELKTQLGEITKAIQMVQSGMFGFLQTRVGAAMRDMSVSVDMSAVDRQILASFLSGKSTGNSGEIVGILTDIKKNLQKQLDTATSTETEAVAALEALIESKKKEILALSGSIESKSIRSGEIAVKHAEMLNDFEDTQEDLAESKKFLLGLDATCEKKRKEWSEYQSLQSEETLALADTIKILNDDDALELFKKTLPGASLLQVKVGAKDVRKRALEVLKQHGSSDPRVEFLEVALRGGKEGFDKIIALMDKLMAQLKKDQDEDDAKKTYCEDEFDKTEDKKKGLQREQSDLETAIDDAKESIMNLKTEIEALDDGIRALDKEVAEATENRTDEPEEFVSVSAANKATVDILKFAKNRLNKFYNPSQYQPPPKRQLSENERIQESMGYSFIQLRGDAAPPPPPEANLAYSTKGEETAGVIQMMDNLIADVEKDMQTMDLEEKDAQGDYEKFMDDAATKRAEDSKSITDKQAALGNTEEELSNSKGALDSTNHKLMETEKYLGSLHAECDWMLKYYDARKEARDGEIDAMDKAKAVLNGADYSL
jgi:chromosome segregation ATPase